MIDYCYHAHTTRCGHAYGSEEEYVLKAIENGFKVLGFTDHVFFPGFSQPGMRGDYHQMEDYIKTIRDLQEKYKDKIEIHVGFECEYSPLYKDYFKFLKEERGIEYLIIGQHLFFDDLTSITWLGRYHGNDEGMKRYTDMVCEAMESGLFTYLAHPDLFMRFLQNVTPYVESCMRRICECAKKNDIPLEINLGGIRGLRPDKPGFLNYPSEEFFSIVSEYGNKVIIGVDAHAPNDFSPEVSDFLRAEEIINKYKLNAITRLNIE
ncbi:MAG: histidinol-phosphatase [Bacilli bacterium]|nr:histidinol-phosphatase [Bacilli bacterium]